MASWRDTVLKDFERGIARLTLVSDPDGLLTEEGMLTEIRSRGFDLIPFDDPIAFRFAYESKYRAIWDSGRQTDLVVVLRSEQDIDKLPYDLLCAGRKLRYSLHTLLPKLTYPVVEAIDRSCLDALYDAYQQHDDSSLGERATKEFVLTHCFRIVPHLVSTAVDLLKLLLSRHYGNAAFPKTLDDFLLASFKSKRHFAPLPLDDIWPHRDKFLRFMQSEWEVLLKSFSDKSIKCLVPFEHQDVRAYVDTYFWEGLLTPVAVEHIGEIPAWAHVGTAYDAHADTVARLRNLMSLCRETLPANDAAHRDWQKTAHQWAELVLMRLELGQTLQADLATAWSSLHVDIETKFERWMLDRFASLHNLPFVPQPVVVHHVPRFLAVERGRQDLAKLALVVIDGIALDQWLLLRRLLEAAEPSWRFDEASVFAWVPTLTMISRQSIFAAEPPLYFADSLDSTGKEQSHWIRFWEDQGVNRSAVEYVKQVESGDSEELNQCLQNPHLAVLGVVVNSVDKIMHGEQQGTAGMHDAIRLWSAKARSILGRLLDSGCAVYITADHGNVAARGIGVPKQGVLVETAGSRARIYANRQFQDEARSQFPDTIEWSNVGLPADRHVLLPSGLRSFSSEGKEVVSHGGIALEEVIVPFVKLSRDVS